MWVVLLISSFFHALQLVGHGWNLRNSSCECISFASSTVVESASLWIPKLDTRVLPTTFATECGAHLI